MLRMFAGNPGYVEDVRLICGFKNEGGIVFHSELEAWKDCFHVTYALDAGTKEGWRTGFVTEFVKEIPFDSLRRQLRRCGGAAAHDEVHRPGAF